MKLNGYEELYLHALARCKAKWTRIGERQDYDERLETESDMHFTMCSSGLVWIR